MQLHIIKIQYASNGGRGSDGKKKENSRSPWIFIDLFSREVGLVLGSGGRKRGLDSPQGLDFSARI